MLGKRLLRVSIVSGCSNESLINSVIEELLRMSSFLDLEIKDLLNDRTINYCIGCKHCFSYGTCTIDKNDNFDIVKNTLMESDLIIIATPVYLNNVSGKMKSFIDRLSYWSHLMKLMGKSAIICVTSKYTGYNDTSKYLYNFCCMLGLNVLGVICKTSNQSKGELEKIISHIMQNVFDFYVLQISEFGNTQLRENYKFFYNNYSWNPRKNITFENEYWSKLSEYRDFDSYLNYLYSSQKK